MTARIRRTVCGTECTCASSTGGPRLTVIRGGMTVTAHSESPAPRLVALRLSRLRRSAFPPVDQWFQLRLACGDLDIARIAELPELLRGAGVLKQDAVDIECVQFSRAEAVRRRGDLRDEFGEVLLVVARHYLAGFLTLRLPGHSLRLVRTADTTAGVLIAADPVGDVRRVLSVATWLLWAGGGCVRVRWRCRAV